jgi:hypothetical protein
MIPFCGNVHKYGKFAESNNGADGQKRDGEKGHIRVTVEI